MTGPLTETGQRYLYVIGHDTGPQKVGFSFYPPNRARTLKKKGEPAPVAHWWSVVPLQDIYAVEALAHWILRDKALGGEMFDITPDEGRVFVEETIARFAVGERAPDLREGARIVRLPMVMSQNFIRRLDEWRRHEPGLPNRSEAIRRIAEAAFDQRESQDQPC